jgi:hypothetical protein
LNVGFQSQTHRRHEHQNFGRFNHLSTTRTASFFDHEVITAISRWSAQRHHRSQRKTTRYASCRDARKHALALANSRLPKTRLEIRNFQEQRTTTGTGEEATLANRTQSKQPNLRRTPKPRKSPMPKNRFHPPKELNPLSTGQ